MTATATRPARERTGLARQPALGLAGLTLVLPVALALGFGVGSPERSLLVLGPLSTFAFPVITTIAFWWEDWPGTIARAPRSGMADTAIVVAGGVVATIAGQAVVSRVDLRGLFDPTANALHAPTFPATMPLGAAVFVAMLQLTLVSEGWPLRRLNRLIGGALAFAAAWAAGVALYEAVVRTGALSGGEFGTVLVCIGALQVTFYVVLGGRPFSAVASRGARVVLANAVVIAGGSLAAVLLCGAATVAVGAPLLYVGLQALAHAFDWTGPSPRTGRRMPA